MKACSKRFDVQHRAILSDSLDSRSQSGTDSANVQSDPSNYQSRLHLQADRSPMRFSGALSEPDSETSEEKDFGSMMQHMSCFTTIEAPGPQFKRQQQKKKLRQQRYTSTKNVLRNMAIAQNHYILHSQRARQLIDQYTSDAVHFRKWVHSLQLATLQDFRSVWCSQEQSCQLYRRLCYRFYCEDAVPYIFGSRIKRSNNRPVHLQCISGFIEGVLHPTQFHRIR